jgi:hypothetical protein
VKPFPVATLSSVCTGASSRNRKWRIWPAAQHSSKISFVTCAFNSQYISHLLEVPVVALIWLRHGKRVETVASNFLHLTKRSSTSCRGQDSWYTHTKAMRVKAWKANWKPKFTLVEVPVVALIRLRHGKRVETVSSNFLHLTKRSSTSCRGQDSWYMHTKAMRVNAWKANCPSCCLATIAARRKSWNCCMECSWLNKMSIKFVSRSRQVVYVYKKPCEWKRERQIGNQSSLVMSPGWLWQKRKSNCRSKQESWWGVCWGWTMEISILFPATNKAKTVLSVSWPISNNTR